MVLQTGFSCHKSGGYSSNISVSRVIDDGGLPGRKETDCRSCATERVRSIEICRLNMDKIKPL